MKNILQTLNQEVGIKGSMVITPDGMMVAAALGQELEEELVAALVSSLLVAARKTATGLRASGELKSCLLHSSMGKIMFYDMGNAYLVVVANTDLKIDSSIIAIRSAIHKIGNRRGA